MLKNKELISINCQKGLLAKVCADLLRLKNYGFATLKLTNEKIFAEKIEEYQTKQIRNDTNLWTLCQGHRSPGSL